MMFMFSKVLGDGLQSRFLMCELFMGVHCDSQNQFCSLYFVSFVNGEQNWSSTINIIQLFL
jgi:hypothetical protein